MHIKCVNTATYSTKYVSIQKSHSKIQCTYICHVQWTARQVNRGASASPMNVPEGNMVNIRQGIVLPAGLAMTRIHQNLYA